MMSKDSYLGTYSSSQISAWPSRGHERSPGLRPALTPTSPGGRGEKEPEGT
jgi:hypothetical protein